MSTAKAQTSVKSEAAESTAGETPEEPVAGVTEEPEEGEAPNEPAQAEEAEEKNGDDQPVVRPSFPIDDSERESGPRPGLPTMSEEAQKNLLGYTGCGCNCDEGFLACLQYAFCNRFVIGLDCFDEHVFVPDNVPWLPQAPVYAGQHDTKIFYIAKMAERWRWHSMACQLCNFPLVFVPCLWPIFCVAPRVPGTAGNCGSFIYTCPCKVDQTCCWKYKNYNQRTYVIIRENAVESNYPSLRIPWGIFGCGSWQSDKVNVHYFDRGAFGFHPVRCGSSFHCCLFWDWYGEVMGRQRCPWAGVGCSKSQFTNRFGCGCDSLLMGLLLMWWHYPGLDNAKEASAAADVALQAYFEEKKLTMEEYDRLLDEELERRGLPPRTSWIRFGDDFFESRVQLPKEVTKAPAVQSMEMDTMPRAESTKGATSTTSMTMKSPSSASMKSPSSRKLE